MSESLLTTNFNHFTINESFNHFIEIIKQYNIKGTQVYDMEIALIMLTNGINTIATFNHKDFKEIAEIEILKDCILT